MRIDLIEGDLTKSVIGVFFEVYNQLRYGFLEHLYVMAMERELLARGHRVGREVPVAVFYKGDHLGFQRIDIVVDETLIVEVKSTQILHPSASRQVYNYLRATHLEVGLLLHFGPEPKFYRHVISNPKKPWFQIPDQPVLMGSASKVFDAQAADSIFATQRSPDLED
jgi:GxxExxY protein